jgi:hypothetical protein
MTLTGALQCSSIVSPPEEPHPDRSFAPIRQVTGLEDPMSDSASGIPKRAGLSTLAGSGRIVANPDTGPKRRSRRLIPLSPLHVSWMVIAQVGAVEPRAEGEYQFESTLGR